MKKIYIILFSLLYCSCSISQDMKSMVKIYYVPLGSETYIPMTVENIEEHYARYASLENSSHEFKNIMSLVQSDTPGQFDNKSVRVKIDMPDSKTIYIDNYGVVMSTNASFLLEKSSLRKVKKILEKVTQQRQ